MAIVRRVYPPAFLLLAVVLMLGLHFLAPVKQVIASPYRYLGVIPLSVGVAVVLWAAGIFRRVGTAIKPFEQSTVLVVDGPYRLSRNPIYLGMVCALIGVGVMLGTLTPFVVAPIFAYWIDRRFIQVEESMLGETFGSEYHAYKTRVRRWL
jgi:protein-S-isoprenylcysteine O-methyltransferase Ste14